MHSLTVEIRVVGIRAGLEEQVGEAVVSVLRRQVERRELVRVVLVNLGASLDQVLRHLCTDFRPFLTLDII